MRSTKAVKRNCLLWFHSSCLLENIILGMISINKNQYLKYMQLVLLSFPIKGKTKNLNIDYALNGLLNTLDIAPPISGK